MTEHDQHDQTIEDQNRDDQISDPTREDVHQTDALDTEEQTEQEPDPRITSARKEAAKYRKRAQEAEARENIAVEMMTNVSRSAVNLMLDAYEVKHDFIWSGGYSPLDFFEADGILNRQKVVEVIKEQEAKLGVKACSQYAYRNGAYEPTTPSIRGGSPGQYGYPPSTGSWSDALRG